MRKPIELLVRDSELKLYYISIRPSLTLRGQIEAIRRFGFMIVRVRFTVM